MKKIMHILFLSCLKATELMEKKLHFEVSFKDKLQLKVHKMMCSACTNYEKQNLLIEKSIANLDRLTEIDKDLDTQGLEKAILEKLS